MDEELFGLSLSVLKCDILDLANSPKTTSLAKQFLLKDQTDLSFRSGFLDTRPRQPSTAEMDTSVELATTIQEISLLTPHSLIENYCNEHKTLLEVTKKALDTCLQDHQPTCPTYPFESKESPPTRFLPTRLIDLENLDCLRLIVTADTVVQDKRYVPLSHRWGIPEGAEREAMITTKANFQDRLDGFGLETLPRRYREAILICRAMDVRYIWIDSLCIIQVYIQQPINRLPHADMINCITLWKTFSLSFIRWKTSMKEVSSPSHQICLMMASLGYHRIPCSGPKNSGKKVLISHGFWNFLQTVRWHREAGVYKNATCLHASYTCIITKSWSGSAVPE
jgi:hypothetical protein